jgi:hypothetical protein
MLALYALLNSLKRKGVLNEQDIEEALQEAEANAIAEAKERDELSKSNAEAIVFPIRFLREANTASKQPETFSTLTQIVAEKDR